MKIEATVTLTKDELNKYVLDGLKADGQPMPAGVELSVVIANLPAPVGPIVSGTMGGLMAAAAMAKTPATAPIGQTLNGFKITHYGYPGDSSPDSNSMKGIGDRGNKLVPNLSVAMNQLARQKQFGVSGASTGKEFQIEHPAISGNFWSFRDDDSAPETDMARVDVYDPFYMGVDAGCTPEMLVRSKGEMIKAGILTA